MSPLTLELLRRIALAALVLATTLAVVPRILTEVGWLGPGVDEELRVATGAIEAAKHYGAPASDPDLRGAIDHLENGRRLASAGKAREARAEARAAEQGAVAAQREALARREQARLLARNVLLDVDRLLNEMEDLYDEVAPGRPKASVAPLVSVMKRARQKGATLFVAFEEERYADVLAGEGDAREAIGAARGALTASRAN